MTQTAKEVSFPKLDIKDFKGFEPGKIANISYRPILVSKPSKLKRRD